MRYRIKVPLAGRRFGLACLGITLLLEVLLAVFARGSGSQFDNVPDQELYSGMAAAFTAFTSMSAVGALILSRMPGHRVGIVFAVAPLLMMVANTLEVYFNLAPHYDLPGRAVLATLLTPSWILGATTLLAFLPPLFPTGRYLSRRWSLLGWLTLGGMAALCVSAVFAPGPVQDFEEVNNPLGVAALRPLSDALEIAGFAALLLSIVMGIASMAVRFRRSSDMERLQMKWVLAATLLVVLYATLGTALLSLTGLPDTDAVILGILSLLPVSVGVAILRYRLYDIDRIINRTLVYASLTAGLAALYFGLVVGLQAAFEPVSGSSDLAIALTTLIVAGLFLPARQRVQAVVDRRFNRRAYDAARTIEVFGARLRQQIDLDTLRYELLAVVDETMQPASVSVWLRPNEGRR